MGNQRYNRRTTREKDNLGDGGENKESCVYTR